MSDMRDCLAEINTDTRGNAAVTGRMTLFAFPPGDVEGTWACLAARQPSPPSSDAEDESSSAEDTTDTGD